MQYVHVRNLEKFHPGYQDRKLIWAKIYFDIVQGDPQFELIGNEVDKWRFVAMVCLELRAQAPLPDSNEYWKSKGFDLKKRPMSLTLKALEAQVEVVDSCGQPVIPLRGRNVEKRREDEEEKNKTGVTRQIPPDPKEVWEYAQTIKLTKQDCRDWWDHHEARGWKLGRGIPMKDWKAALRTWGRNKNLFSKNAGNVVPYRPTVPEKPHPEFWVCQSCDEKMPWLRQYSHECRKPDAQPTEDEVNAELRQLKKELKHTQ